jgi:hypothetical protein
MGKRTRTKKNPQRDRLGRARKHLGEAHAYASAGHQSYRVGAVEAAVAAVLDYLEFEQDRDDEAMKIFGGGE